MMHRIDQHEAIESIIAQLTLDLAECIESSWAVAMTSRGGRLVPLFNFGQHPNLEQCIARTEILLAKQTGTTALATARGLSSCSDWVLRIICPVSVSAEIFAVLTFGPRIIGGDYTERDCELVEQMAAHLSFLASDGRMAAKIGTELSQLQRTKIELQTARQVQDRSFPYGVPPIRGLDYHGASLPVGEVGGDFFDFVGAGDSSLVLSIGDISGKGVPAAIIMTGLVASLRALRETNRDRISDLVRDLNRVVWTITPDNFFATMFHARIDSAQQELHYVNAGQGGAILVRENPKRAVYLKSTGTVLGLNKCAAYQQRIIRLEPGDVLVAVTDGITEAADPDGRILDTELLVTAVRNHPEASSGELAEHILTDVDAFMRGAPLLDDRTVVVVRLLGNALDAVVSNYNKDCEFVKAAAA